MKKITGFERIQGKNKETGKEYDLFQIYVVGTDPKVTGEKTLPSVNCPASSLLDITNGYILNDLVNKPVNIFEEVTGVTKDGNKFTRLARIELIEQKK